MALRGQTTVFRIEGFREFQGSSSEVMTGRGSRNLSGSTREMGDDSGAIL